MSRFRGYEIRERKGEWFFTDTGEPVASTWRHRPCGHCRLYNTPEGHDGCIGTIEGAINACCGHGDAGTAYVQLADGTERRGPDAWSLIDQLRKEE